MKPALLRVDELHVDFSARAGWLRRKRVLRAVDGVGFSLAKNQALGIVGESGSGKSSLGRVVVGLLKPSAGRIVINGVDRYAPGKAAHDQRRTAQIVFQDPFASLNPRRTIAQAIGDPLRYNGLLPNAGQRRERVRELLALVGLGREALDKYPHEFSGGQLQRACIARAIALEGELLVLDEAVSALDAIHRRHVLDLLISLRQTLGLAYLFISHDLAAVSEASERIAVMHLGSFVEVAATGALNATPLHPYTQALLSSIPLADPWQQRQRKPLLLAGDPPSPLAPPSGCGFRTRCPHASPRCERERPALREVAAGHSLACHRIY